MKPLVLALMLLSPFTVIAQTNAVKDLEELVLGHPHKQVPKPTISKELENLRQEYVTATREYQQSLVRLSPFYQKDIARAEEKLALSKKLVAEGLVDSAQIEENEKLLRSAKEKLAATERQIANADKQIAEAQDDAKFFAEYKHAVVQRKRERKRPCSEWTLTTYYRVNKNSVESGYRFACQ
jgi:hypothetical protein